MVTLSKKAQREADAWSARVAAEALEAGQLVSARRCIADAQKGYILHDWWEPAVITEIRTFDALVRFADGTVQSSGLGLRAFTLPVI